MRFSYYVTLSYPGKPVTYWNRRIKAWVPLKSLDCEYGSSVGSKIGAAHKRKEYSESELKHHIGSDFLSSDHPKGTQNDQSCHTKNS